MKNLIYVLIIVFIGLFAFSFYNNKKGAALSKNTDEDYKKIEAVHNAMEKLTRNNVITAAPNQNAWTIFDLRLIYQNDNQFYAALKKELGDDFDTKLSTGDYIFVGILPMYQKYKIYAISATGTPDDKVDMLYPDWTYEKLEKK